MASLDEVERRLEELLQRLRDTDGARASLRTSVPESRVLALRVKDLDADYWAQLSNRDVGELRAGEPEEAHVRIEATSDDVVALASGELSFLVAYLGGRVRVEADPADLMRLRRLL